MLFGVFVLLNIIEFSFFSGLKAALNVIVSSLDGTAWMTIGLGVHVLLACLTLLDAWGC